MNKKLFLMAMLQVSFLFYGKAQFTFEDVKFWVGSGSDSAVLVVDFRDGTTDSSYAWGYLFNAPASGEDMVMAIAAADINLDILIESGFLSDIVYNDHIRLGGEPDYWSTWSGTSSSSFTMNGGLGATLSNGSWFACSYGFDPAPAAPGEPIPAFDPNAFTFDDLTFFAGSGKDTAMLVVDFQNGTDTVSFAWGFLFNDSTTGADILAGIAAADSLFDVNMGNYLNDIIYGDLEGINGNPNFWGTWSATNMGNWYMNAGISSIVKNREIFGCTYTDFSPALRPGYPSAAKDGTIGIPEKAQRESFSFYPVPANDFIWLQFESDELRLLELYGINGERILKQLLHNKKERIDLSTMPAGTYFIKIGEKVEKIVIR